MNHPLSNRIRMACCAILLAAAVCPVRATDVLAICDSSSGKGLWRLVMDPDPGQGAAGTIEVEQQGAVVATLRTPKDRFDLLTSTPYLLVFRRGADSGFNRNFSLQDSKKGVQRFSASVEMSRALSSAPAPDPAGRPVKVRLARRNGEVPGTTFVNALQQYIHFEYDHHYLDILADHLPAGWDR
jgi:hypothetical protein